MNSHLTVVLLLTPAFLCPLALAAQRLAFPHDERGSISGRVLLSPQGLPARGVSVRLSLSTGALQATVLTDGNGEYQFFGITSGVYLIAVEELGYDTIQETVQAGFGGDPDHVLVLTKTNVLPPGQSSVLVSVRELSIPSKARKEFLKGLQFQAKNDHVASLPHFQRAVQEFPAYYEAFLQIGFVYRHLGQQVEAEKAVRNSIELSGDGFAEADFTLGEILAEQKQYSGAEEAARRGLVLKPASWVGHYILARSLFALNRLKEAEESARTVLTLKQDFARTHLLLANIHLGRNDKVSLVRDLNAYLVLDPGGAMSAQVRRMRETVERDLAGQQQSPPLAAAIP